MSVDVGVDIVAIKENSLISIQVKTANLNKFNTYIFDVRKASFERHNANNVYYIFVLHGDERDDFIILPFFEMEKKIKERAALPVQNGERYRISIKERNGKIYLGKKEYEIDYYLNNRDIIK
jgi:hypothetical protein